MTIQNQAEKLRDFAEAGGTHGKIKPFRIRVEAPDMLRVSTILNVGHFLNKEMAAKHFS
jgi:hypothetical protein